MGHRWNLIVHWLLDDSVHDEGMHEDGPLLAWENMTTGGPGNLLKSSFQLSGHFVQLELEEIINKARRSHVAHMSVDVQHIYVKPEEIGCL